MFIVNDRSHVGTLGEPTSYIYTHTKNHLGTICFKKKNGINSKKVKLNLIKNFN